MLYREILAVCSEIHTKHINTLCGQNVEFVTVKPGGTQTGDHWATVAVPQVSSITGCSLRRLEWYSIPPSVGFVVLEVTLAHVLLRACYFPLSVIVPPALHIHSLSYPADVQLARLTLGGTSTHSLSPPPHHKQLHLVAHPCLQVCPPPQHVRLSVTTHSRTFP
jgi:hypothetical protein